MNTEVKNTRVLHVINGEFYAGAERVQDLLALRLPEFGYTTDFVCLKAGVFAEERRATKAALYPMPMRSKLDVLTGFRLGNLATRHGYRLIHTHSRRAALIGQLASMVARIPMVHHLHSPSDKDTEERWRNLINIAAEHLSLLRAKKLIPVSASLERYLRDRRYEPERIRLVCNGVPAHDPTRLPFRTGEPLVLGTVALFRPRKGIESLLRAMAILKEAGHHTLLHAVGPFETREYEDSVVRLVEELGLTAQVHWTGFTNDVAAEFRYMHVFVLPSLFGEGMPMVVLEAMAAGLAVVSTYVEGIPEVVRDGKDGLLVAPDDPGELSRALRRIAAGEADIAALGDSGRNRQREKFSDTAMAHGVAAVYREVLTNQP